MIPIRFQTEEEVKLKKITKQLKALTSKGESIKLRAIVDQLEAYTKAKNVKLIRSSREVMHFL